MYRRLILAILLLASIVSFAQYGPGTSQSGVKLRSRSSSDLLASQKVLVSNYCRLDFEGARLQPSGWTRFKPVTTLRANPEFTYLVIVSRFNIESPQEASEYLSADYQQIGYYHVNDGFKPLSTNDRVTFRLQEQNGNLAITELSSGAPHVSPRAAIAWMNARLADPNTSEPERVHLKEAITQLDKFAPQRQPATNTAGS